MLNEQEKIDRYLNNEMKETERQAFENAMEHNIELAEAVALNKDIMHFFKERNPDLEKSLTDLGDEFFNETAPTVAPKSEDDSRSRTGIILGLGLLIVASIAGLYFYNFNNPTTQYDIDNSTNIDVEKVVNEGMLYEGGAEGILTDEPIEEEEQQETEQEEKPDNASEENTEKNPPMAIADTDDFKANTALESLIRENIRSNESITEITFPKVGYIFKLKNDVVNFQLKGKTVKNQSVDITIYDNKADSFTNNNPVLSASKTFDNEVFSYNVNIELNPGLYYYIVRDKETASIIHISKFLIKK